MTRRTLPSSTDVRRSRPRTGPCRLAVAATVGALALLGAACGSDDGTAGSDAASVTTISIATAASDPTCAAWLVADEAGSALGDPDAPPELTAAAVATIQESLVGLEAPEPIAASLAAVTAAVEAAAGGDPEAFSSPEVVGAITEVGAWVHDECGFEAVELTLTDHRFEGVPASVDAGPVSFRTTNDGAEAHVLVIQRIADDVTTSVDELAAGLADGTVAAGTDLTPVVSGAFAAPGDTAYLTVALEPGRYLVLCPIPAGFTGEGPPPAGAPPHSALGMVAELTVA